MPEGQEIPGKEKPFVRSTVDLGKPVEVERPHPSPSKEVERTLAERHPDWPHIKLKFYFSPHKTVEDMTGMEQQISDADIYLYEGQVSEGVTQGLQEVSDLDLRNAPPDLLDQVIKVQKASFAGVKIEGSRIEPIIRSLMGSKKIVGNIDMRAGDPINTADIKAIEKRSYVQNNFDKTLDNYKKKLADLFDANDQREKIMVGHFEDELEKILTEHPELKYKPELKILHTMGAAHTSLSHKFQAAGVDTESVFPEMPHEYGFGAQAYHEIADGKEPSRDVLARAYMEERVNTLMRLTKTENFSSMHILNIDALSAASGRAIY